MASLQKNPPPLSFDIGSSPALGERGGEEASVKRTVCGEEEGMVGAGECRVRWPTIKARVADASFSTNKVETADVAKMLGT